MSKHENDVLTLLVSIAEGQLLLLEQLGEVDNQNDFSDAVARHKDEFHDKIKAIHARILQDRSDAPSVYEDRGLTSI